MPFPVSRMRTRNPPGSGLSEETITRPPAGVNLMALRIRFQKTCCRRPPSAEP